MTCRNLACKDGKVYNLATLTHSDCPECSPSKKKNGEHIITQFSMKPGSTTYLPSDVYATHEGELYRLWYGVAANKLQNEIRQWRPVPAIRDIDSTGEILDD